MRPPTDGVPPPALRRRRRRRGRSSSLLDTYPLISPKICPFFTDHCSVFVSGPRPPPTARRLLVFMFVPLLDVSLSSVALRGALVVTTWVRSVALALALAITRVLAEVVKVVVVVCVLTVGASGPLATAPDERRRLIT